ncbi:MAG: hypothetical protein KTR20_02505 [Cellvibrionaceae bacterium]|nr:hypothetical protein [Cellvibrionaceae bacterium]
MVLCRQRGYLLPLALLLLLSMSVMAAFMARQLALARSVSLVDTFAAQAFYAADSGSQWGLYTLLTSDAHQQPMSRRCANLSLVKHFAAAGLSQCELVVSCVCVYQDGGVCGAASARGDHNVSEAAQSIYRISSVASCGRGAYLARRQQVVNALSADAAHVKSANPAGYRGHDRVLSWQ